VLAALAAGPGTGFVPGFETISAADLERDATAIAAPEFEGRDTPSLGLEEAARWIEARFGEAGLGFAPDSLAAFKAVQGAEAPVPARSDPADGTFRRPYRRRLGEPDPKGCALVLESGSDAARTFDLLRDFVPVRGCEGTAEGEVVFAGYGIQSRTEGYDDFAGLKLKDRIALILEGEPRTKDRRFEGPELSQEASLWEKVDALEKAGAAGVLVARRPAAPAARTAAVPGAGPGAGSGAARDGSSARPLGFRSTWAEFNGVASDPMPRHPLPVLEVSLACAGEILGQDVEGLARKIDKSVHPVRAASTPGAAARRVRMQGRTVETQVRADNVVGLARGEDLALAEEYVVVGAHYDHVGVDARGRVGCGADDNASGVAAMLEIAEALAAAGTRRSVIFCAFAGEEDGLLGSRAFCESPPVPKGRIVAMVNLDMIGRGEAAEVAVLGIPQNPSFEKVLGRARKLRPTGVREVVVRQGEELFQRSDHFAFHEIGVPALFFFEGLPIDRNKDYHTWRDTLDKLDYRKILNTTRLVYNTVWILAQDDERPPPPRD